MSKIKIDHLDEGFCRINYVFQNEEGKHAYYCIQDEGPYVLAYSCSSDFEPCSTVNIKKGKQRHEVFEVPKGNTELEVKIRNWLNKEI